MLRFLALLLALLAAPAPAQDRAAVERQFRAWLEGTVWPQARGEGVSRATFDAALGAVRLDWDLPDLVPPGAVPTEQHQAEFRAPSAYFAGVPDAVAAGRGCSRNAARPGNCAGSGAVASGSSSRPRPAARTAWRTPTASAADKPARAPASVSSTSKRRSRAGVRRSSVAGGAG